MDAKKKMDAEAKYVGGDMTLKALADAEGIPLTTIKRWCKAGNWVEKRKNTRKRAVNKAITRATDKKARELQKLLEASGSMERALAKAAKQLEKATNDKESRILTDGKFRAGNINQIVYAIGRQAETRMMISGLMTAAEKEKIELLRKRQELEEKREALSAAQAAESVQFIMDEETEALSE